jgi:acyl-CoA hydrolase
VSEFKERVANKQLLAKRLPVEEAVKHVRDGMTVAVSGFTKSGEPKRFLIALAKHLGAVSPDARITLLSGASLSEETESLIAPFVGKRAPYMSSSVSRSLIHSGKMDFSDFHLSAFARGFMYGFYGEVDIAVVEVCRILDDGSAVLTSSVGLTAEILCKAKKIFLEVNTQCPDYTGFHDLLVPTAYPDLAQPIPLVNVSDRIGEPVARFDLSKVVAVVESRVLDHPVPFKPVSPTDQKLAANVIDFLLQCRKRFAWGDRLPPIQSGVGNIANAIVGELYRSPFQKLRFWTEVFQDGMMRCLEDPDKFEYASATAISFSSEASLSFTRNFCLCRDRIVLRPMWVSNSPELVTRLFVIAMNTPLEFDIYGNVNSTHVGGSKLVNGLGGSGDFLRNAYLSVIHAPSVRQLRDGRTVSCVMPYLRHIDHTKHDIKCYVTDQGYADNIEILSPRKRAHKMIDQCAHPHFRPALREYLRIAGEGDEPHPTDLRALQNWWQAYDEACRTFPAS